MRRFLPFLLLFAVGHVVSAQSAIGEWRDHNSFVAARHVCVAQSEVYAATRMALFRYRPEGKEVIPMTKSNGLVTGSAILI